MAKSNAERQASYRSKRAESGKEGNGERRLNTWVDTGTALALARLANSYGVTRREILERLVMLEDKKVLAELELDSPEWEAYFGVNSLRRNE
ncbi:hypothetical protein [uncultured Deefgea sp.]|uniref:hypothetical protein n=1 Tax=uncultured Deefgea sp. TaxID=1304914 RepID=UPI0026282E9E|nr:hypothetical protein [uncultured Deefgea sp.]